MEPLDNVRFEIAYSETPTCYRITRKEMNKQEISIELPETLFEVSKRIFTCKDQAQCVFSDLINKLDETVLDCLVDGVIIKKKVNKKISAMFSPGSCFVLYEVLPIPFKVTAL